MKTLPFELEQAEATKILMDSQREYKLRAEDLFVFE
jgi:hypothetical protein